jgi:hypothetical protein
MICSAVTPLTNAPNAATPIAPPTWQAALSTAEAVPDLAGSTLVFARQCIDWSERRNHLAGALGSALAQHLFELGWIERVRESRAVRITEIGRRELKRLLGVASDN